MDMRSLRFRGTLIAVTVTGPGEVVFSGFVMICFNVTDMSLFGRSFIPVTLTPSTELIPKVPKIDELLNIFAKFKGLRPPPPLPFINPGIEVMFWVTKEVLFEVALMFGVVIFPAAVEVTFVAVKLAAWTAD